MSSQPLPSRKKLLVSTAVAVLIAAVILLTVVLPVEYRMDPLGTGRLLGLTAMSKPVIASTVTAAPQTSAASVMYAHQTKFRNERIDIQLKSDEELEYKATLAKGEPLLYTWHVKGGPVYFEFHGEPTTGDWPKNYFQSYEKGDEATEAHGSFIAPFTGNHGWYWLNLSGDPATITLEVSGYYTWLGRVGEAAPKE